MDVWNHKMFINIYRNLKYTKFTKLVRVRNFITFELKVFFYMRRERETHNLYMLTAFTSSVLNPTNAQRRRAQSRLASPSSESQPSSFEADTQLTTFSQILSPRFRCVTSPKYPGPNSFLWFVFWHLLMTHPLRANVNTCVNVATN